MPRLGRHARFRPWFFPDHYLTVYKCGTEGLGCLWIYQTDQMFVDYLYLSPFPCLLYCLLEHFYDRHLVPRFAWTLLPEFLILPSFVLVFWLDYQWIVWVCKPLRWCMVISDLRFLMLRDNLLNLSTNSCMGYPFSCLTFKRARDDLWCGRIIAYWVLNLVVKALKLSTEFGRKLSKPAKCPFFDRGGKNITPYHLIYSVEVHLGFVHVQVLIRICWTIIEFDV